METERRKHTSFCELLSNGNHCKRTPKFITLGINLNKRGVVTCRIIICYIKVCRLSVKKGYKEKAYYKASKSKFSYLEKPTRLRAVVPRRSRYIFAFRITQIQVSSCNKTIAMRMKRHSKTN